MVSHVVSDRSRCENDYFFLNLRKRLKVPLWEGPTQAATADLPCPAFGAPGKPAAFLAGPLGRKKPV